MKPRVAVTEEQRLVVAQVLIEQTRSTKGYELAKQIGVCQPYISAAMSFPHGRSRCPGWAILRIIQWSKEA